MIASPQ